MATARSGFMFKRPAIDNNDAFDAAGMKWTMVKPFEELKVDFVGKVVLLSEPEQMADPKAAFTNNPFDEAEVHLTFTGQGRAEHVRRRARRTRTRRRARSSPRVTTNNSSPPPARSRSAPREWDIHGFGLRDHSWGPRYWQAPWYYRWLTANVDENFGFMASRVAKKDGPGSRGGFVWENGTIHLCDDVEITTVTRGDDQYHDQIEGVLRSSRSDREWEFSGRSLSLIPLRNRRQAPDGEWLQTRISEAYTEWTVRSGEFEGRTGYGMSEYLDQIIDGAPVGLAE